MYFADLTPYEYGPVDAGAIVLNVGWLDVGHTFERGPCEDAFVAKLERLVESPVNLYGGVHFCSFCAEPPIALRPHQVLDRRPENVGNGEIRVRGADDLTYAAPVLVSHYVKAHGYRPPVEFVEAVLSAPVDGPKAGDLRS